MRYIMKKSRNAGIPGGTESTQRPVCNKTECEVSSREDVARNYRAILNKLNEKPSRKKYQPFVYVAGIAVLAVVAATGISQIGNYQNLKTLEQTLQTFPEMYKREVLSMTVQN